MSGYKFLTDSPTHSHLTQDRYIGRFAPSPTGPLHLGSLFTALASYLDAKSQGGTWLLRIDDLDTPRNQAGSVDSILKCLDAFGLHWDDKVYYQSQHLDAYTEALNRLTQQGLTYRCACSRKTLSEQRISIHESTSSENHIYPGICRNKMIAEATPHAIRLKTDSSQVTFTDGLQGKVNCNLSREHGDFILKRKDGVIAYQLAVVIDDHLQRVNHVVRGCDLLTETAKQLYLQKLLNYAAPTYTHVPVIVDNQAFKLSKQTQAQAVNINNPEQTLFELLVLLNQNPPPDIKNASASVLINWALANWRPSALVRQVTVSKSR
jgi:glutamyl-Q tRNA(Asp) synthetase